MDGKKVRPWPVKYKMIPTNWISGTALRKTQTDASKQKAKVPIPAMQRIWEKSYIASDELLYGENCNFDPRHIWPVKLSQLLHLTRSISCSETLGGEFYTEQIYNQPNCTTAFFYWETAKHRGYISSIFVKCVEKLF